MSLVYQYDSSGYFVGQCDDYGDSMPHNCTALQPVLQEGFIPRWVGASASWEQVENHKGVEGYLNGEAYTIKDYGPLPDGFSTSKPLPSLDEAKKQARQELKSYRQQIEYGGFMLNGQRWDSEQKDELRLNSAGKIFEAGVPEYPGWKIADGVYITLTPQLLQQATIAFMQHTGAAFALEAAKLGQIEALDSSEAVLAWLENDMKTGWGRDDFEPESGPESGPESEDVFEVEPNA